MKKFLLLGCATFLLISCTSSKKLYDWKNYESASYQYYKKQTPEASLELMKTYETMIKNPKGTRKTIAPGIYAEYGYFLLQNGKKEEGIAMLKKEKELYPESSAFMDRLINRFSE